MNAFDLWTLIIGGITLLAYLCQLFVLILIYYRVIKDANINAQERQRAIDNAASQFYAMSQDVEKRLNGMVRQNILIVAAFGACVFLVTLLPRRTVNSSAKDNV